MCTALPSTIDFPLIDFAIFDFNGSTTTVTMRYCAHGIVPTGLYPHGIVPNRNCDHTVLCPTAIVPTRDCAHTVLCPTVIVPTRDCAHT